MIRRITVQFETDEVTPQSIRALRQYLDSRGPGESLTQALHVVLRAAGVGPTLDDPPWIDPNDYRDHDQRRQLWETHHRTHAYCVPCELCAPALVCHHRDHENYCPHDDGGL